MLVYCLISLQQSCTIRCRLSHIVTGNTKAGCVVAAEQSFIQRIGGSIPASALLYVHVSLGGTPKRVNGCED